MDYLKPYEKYCNLLELDKLKSEREKWLHRPSQTPYRTLLENLPNIKAEFFSTEGPHVTIGTKSELSSQDKSIVNTLLKNLVPWRKGPFNIFGTELDAEWRSDLKWERIKKALPNLNNKKILDVGCNNGYFLFKMMEQNPALALGIDPVVHYKAQFETLKNFLNFPNLHFELFGIEHVNYFQEFFDVIFSMGIIYHHRNPIAQLIDMREAMKPGGTLVLETIGIPGKDSVALFPEGRYGKMRNVWFVPTLSCFVNWTKKARFIDVEVLSDTPLTLKEQRLTDWCPSPHQSLEDFLDPDDQTKTIEGHPAPRRFAIIAKKRE